VNRYLADPVTVSGRSTCPAVAPGGSGKDAARTVLHLSGRREETMMDTLLVIALLAGGVALVVSPVLLITWWEWRDQRRLVEEMQRFLAPGPTVRRAAVGRVRPPVWRTATIVGMVVLGLTLPWYAVDVVLLVAAGIFWALKHEPRVVATTDVGIVVIATTWRWHPLRVVAQLDHSAWRAPARRLGPQTLGPEVLVLRSGQAKSLPGAPTR